MAHKLTDRNTEALTATCSDCGPSTPIARNGRAYVCREGRREATRRFRAAHPERVRQSKRRPPSKHRLTLRTGEPDTCAVCGPVTPKPMGRGFGCPNRAKEMGWNVFAEAPQPACPVCRTYLDRYGSCAKCDDDLSDLETAHLPAEARRRTTDITSQFLEAGFSITSWELPLPADEERPAVHGWKTLGSTAPVNEHKVRPEYAALYGSGSR